MPPVRQQADITKPTAENVPPSILQRGSDGHRSNDDGNSNSTRVPDNSGDKRVERLAINIPDISRMDEFVRQQALGGKIHSSPIHIDKNVVDEIGVEFSCDLLTAAALCDIIRDGDRKRLEYPTRVYLNKGTTRSVWVRLPQDIMLSIVEKGECKLNPKVFPEQLELAPITPLPTEAIEL